MAIQKIIPAEFGMSVDYHRITNLIVYTNAYVTINVKSYRSKSDRDAELDYLTSSQYRQNLLSKPESELTLEEKIFLESPEKSRPSYYTQGFAYIMPYEDGVTIDKAYLYLKTLPDFEGAIDC